MADYFSFEDVMGELELGEEELKRMVSEGELRAFRDENKMKFKKEDVENLKKGRITEPTIILPSTPATDKTDETVLDLDIGAETAALSETSASQPTVDFDEAAFEVKGKAPTGRGKKAPEPADTDDDLIVTEPSSTDVTAEAEETFIEEESDTGLSTEPLKLADDASAEETIEAETVSEEMTTDTAEVAAPSRRGGTRMGRRVTAQVPMAVEEEIERKRAHPIWTFFTIVTFVIAAFSGLFFYDMMRLESGAGDQPMGTTGGLAKWILEKQFWSDSKWTKYHEDEYPEGGAMKPPIKEEKNPLINYPDAVYRGPSFEMPDAAPREEVGQ